MTKEIEAELIAAMLQAAAETPFDATPRTDFDAEFYPSAFERSFDAKSAAIIAKAAKATKKA